MRHKKNLFNVALIAGLSLVLCAFVLGTFSRTPIHVAPIKVGVDTSEILRFSSGSEKINYYTYLPNKVNDSMKVMFVMHGTDRNAKDYLHAWMKFADSNNYLIVAPEFTELAYDETFDYQEGNLWNQSEVWSSKEDWAFLTIERIFSELKTTNVLSTDFYSIFGHSAGAQFVHRMLLFLPESHIKYAFAANAGWYTFPNCDVKFPYGLKNTLVGDESLARSFGKQLFVLLGANDDKSEHLRQTKNANEQGRTRIARGNNFFRYSQDKAKQISTEFNWTKKIIKQADHNYILMSKEAQNFLVKN
jgi:hypothetical protein